MLLFTFVIISIILLAVITCSIADDHCHVFCRPCSEFDRNECVSGGIVNIFQYAIEFRGKNVFVNNIGSVLQVCMSNTNVCCRVHLHHVFSINCRSPRQLWTSLVACCGCTTLLLVLVELCTLRHMLNSDCIHQQT